MIGFDRVFPKVARTLALQGAGSIYHPYDRVQTHCQPAMLVPTSSQPG